MSSQDSPSLLLVKNGFIKSSKRYKYDYDKRLERFVPKDIGKLGGYDPKDADEEMAEEVNYFSNGSLQSTGYPKPFKRYRLVYESFNLSMEETYYWILGHIRQDQGFPNVIKITDIFSAAENSAFFGQSAQRLSIQEDRASNFLRTIGQLVKELFQLVRELRIIDERLEPYKEWEHTVNGETRRSKAADVTLKGVFTDFAENKGGQMQPGSLYHLAQQVGYTTLPDLFFNTHIYDKDNVDTIIDRMDTYNLNVRQVLKRKLYQYLIWKEKTHGELVNRRSFLIRYLRQHWATIKMYMNWTKPYLRHIRRLTMNQDQMDSPDLVSAFETSMTEIEFLATKPDSGMNQCILATFNFNTRPIMQYRQEYQQGPVHVGRVTFTLRSYAWTDEQIKAYRQMKEDEEKELLGLVDESVAAAMEELGDDLQRYINEEGKDIFDKDLEKKMAKEGPIKFKKLPSAPAFEPFTALLGGFKDMFTMFVPIPDFKGGRIKGYNPGKAKGVASKASKSMWLAYKNYKASHGLMKW